MFRLSIGVCTTALLLLALANPSAALPSKKAAQQKRGATATARKSASCAPCTQLARHRKSSKAEPAPCHSKNYVDPSVAINYKTAIREMKREGIKPKVTSTWRSSELQKQLHACSESARCRRQNPGLYYALPAGKSLHEAGLAVDISGVAAGPRGRKRLTPQGHKIVSIMRKNGFNWRYRLADPAHFEADPKKHGARTVKQAIMRSQATCQVKLASKSQKKSAGKTASRQSRVAVNTRLSAQTSSTKVHRHLHRTGA